jgi:hypothetical protein
MTGALRERASCSSPPRVAPASLDRWLIVVLLHAHSKRVSRVAHPSSERVIVVPPARGLRFMEVGDRLRPTAAGARMSTYSQIASMRRSV